MLSPPKIPSNMIKHYIRGFIDGDGSIGWHRYNDKPRLSIVSGSFDILEWIKINIENNIHVGNPSISYRDKNKNEIEYMGYQVYSILDWIYDNSTPETRLKRKYERYKKYLLMR